MVAYTDKIARVYMGTELSQLTNLTEYSDPLGLKDSLKELRVSYNGEGPSTYSIDLTIINPSLQFEDNFLQLYRMYFMEDREFNSISELDDPTLDFFVRWGYGDSEDDGLSRVLSCKLNDIRYSYTALNEKTIILSFADNLSFSVKNDPAHQKGTSTVVVSKVNCIEDGKLRNPGNVIQEVLSKYIATLNGVVPAAFMYSDRGPSYNIDRLYNMIVARIATGNINPNVAIEGLGKEVQLTSDNFVGLGAPDFDVSFISEFSGINIDLIPGATWDNIKVGSAPSIIHYISAYQMLMNELGLTFSIGYTEPNSISNKEDELLDVGVDLKSQLSAAEQEIYGAEFESLNIPIPLTQDVYSGIYESGKGSIGTVQEILNNPELKDKVFPDEALVNGVPYLRPGGLGRLTYGLANEWYAGTSQYSISRQNRYYTNPSLTYYVDTGVEAAESIFKALTSIKASLLPESDPTFDKVLEENPLTSIQIQGDEIYATLTLTKSSYVPSTVVIDNLINNINRAIMPLDQDKGAALTLFQVPWSSLTDNHKSKVSLKTRGIAIKDTNSIGLISSRQNIKSLFGFDTEADTNNLALQSFPGIQNGNILNLNLGYNDSIVLDVQFDESILAAYPTTMNTFNLFKEIAEVFVSKGESRDFKDIVSILTNELLLSQVVGVDAVLLNQIKRLTDSETDVEFFNRYISFVTKAEQGEFGDRYKGIITSSKYAQAFVKIANSNNLRLLFGDDIQRRYSYEIENNSIKIDTTEDFKSVSLGDDIIGFLSEEGDIDVSDYIRIRTNEYLYNDMSFKLKVLTLGIPEMSNPIIDLGEIGTRRVWLRISETRLPGSADHWLSGYYKVIGYTHVYNESKGYTTSFNLVRSPYYSKETLF